VAETTDDGVLALEGRDHFIVRVGVGDADDAGRRRKGCSGGLAGDDGDGEERSGEESGEDGGPEIAGCLLFCKRVSK
jgi:hypothetical protein